MSNPNLPISGKYNTYIGARYVPLMGGEWNQDKAYEPLVIVTHQGNSYTSNTFVPAGVDINDKTYWTLTGNYNGQVEQYRNEVQGIKQEISQLNDSLGETNNNLTELQNTINANETDIEGKVASIQYNLSHITPISYGTPDFNTVDIMIFGRGFINYPNINLPVSDIQISMTDTMTPVPFHKNVVFVLNYGDEDHINNYLTFIINQEPKLQYAKFFLMLKPPTSFDEFKSYISSHRTLLNTASDTHKYIYNMYPVCSQWEYYANSMGGIIRAVVGAAIYGNDIPMSVVKIYELFETQKLGKYGVDQIITPFQTYQKITHVGGSYSQFTPVNRRYSESIDSNMNFFHGKYTECGFLSTLNNGRSTYVDDFVFAPESSDSVQIRTITPNNDPTTIQFFITGFQYTTPIIESDNRSSEPYNSEILVI